MQLFTQITMVIGEITPQHIAMTGTGFLISNDGKIVTTRHAIGKEHNNLVVLFPHINNINEYQDLSDNSCTPVPAKIIEIDPIKDLCILQTSLEFVGPLPKLGTLDKINVGEEIGIFGYPHCIEGRRSLTFQKTEIGAKVLVDSNGIKVKNAVINTQARPGQSGSLIYSPRINEIVGVLVGAWGGNSAMGGISLGGINPRELHQTTHCISAEYIREMI